MKPEHPYRSTTHEEKFVHIALYDANGVVCLPGTKHKCSHKTVFARKEVSGPGIIEAWYASVAYCDARDQFSREVGRKVARRKYFSGKRCSVPEAATSSPAAFHEWATSMNLNHV